MLGPRTRWTAFSLLAVFELLFWLNVYAWFIELNSLRPELVVLLGDYVNGHHRDADRSPAENQQILGGIATFAALNARYGAVAVLGNHDSWYNRQAVTTALQEAGAAALSNRNIVIHRSGGAVVIAGLEDAW